MYVYLLFIAVSRILPPLEIITGLTPNFSTSINDDIVSSVLPEYEQIITNVFLFTHLGIQYCLFTNIGKLIFSNCSYPGNLGNLSFPIFYYPGNVGNLSFPIFYYPGNIWQTDFSHLLIILKTLFLTAVRAGGGRAN